jgi:hypothetical protein
MVCMVNMVGMVGMVGMVYMVGMVGMVVMVVMVGKSCLAEQDMQQLGLTDTCLACTRSICALQSL